MEKNESGFVNYTPHTIRLISGDTVLEIEPSGTVARAVMKEISLGPIHGWPMISREPKEIIGLPEQNHSGNIYIVSSMVLDAVARLGDGRWRLDVVAPDTGPTAQRDVTGQIIGVTRLVGIL